MCYSSHFYAPSPLIISTANCDIVLLTVRLPLPLGWPHLEPSAPKQASLLCFGICQEQTRHIVGNYFQVSILTPPQFPFCCNLQSTHTTIQSAFNVVAGNHRVRRTPHNYKHVFQPKWDPRCHHHRHSPIQSAIPNILLRLFDRWMFCVVWICQPLIIAMINSRNPIGCKELTRCEFRYK